jgi:EAL and modified HD-GYP domain-containing signal transduction protein
MDPVFVARQPILDHGRLVFGYELLCGGPQLVGRADALESRPARVVADALMGVGLDALTDGRRAFIGITRRMLLEEIPAVLPPARVVLQLRGDVEADAEVVAACRSFRHAGYRFAIDDFVLNDWTADLVRLADFVKVDPRAGSDGDWKQLAGMGGDTRVTLIAKGVDTAEAFALARREGFTYCQGFFYGRPERHRVGTLPGQQVNNLRLLHALQDPELSVFAIEELIKPDPALCYRVLRAVNSAASAVRTEITSIRHALIMLGCATIRRWASLWTLARLNENSHPELVAVSAVRGRACEQLAASSGADPGEAFLLGMCSLLDAILERPMAAILETLPLSAATRDALAGVQNDSRCLLDCVIAYEAGDWTRCVALAAAAGVEPIALQTAFGDALRWAHGLKAA